MRQILLYILVLLIGGPVVVFLPKALNALKRPIALLEGDLEHDFGMVDLTAGPTTLHHLFDLRNARSYPIRIEHISSSCGCLVTRIDDETIERGETLKLGVDDLLIDIPVFRGR